MTDWGLSLSHRSGHCCRRIRFENTFVVSDLLFQSSFHPFVVLAALDVQAHLSAGGDNVQRIPVGQGLQNEEFTNAKTAVPNETTVESDQTVTFSLKLMTPQVHDDYHMYYNMYKEGTGCFRQQNNIEWKTELSIEPVK